MQHEQHNLVVPDRLSELKAAIPEQIALAEAHYESALQAAIHAGSMLSEAKSLVAHGEWLPYLSELELPARTAQNYMRLSRNALDVAHLGTVSEAIAALTEPKEDAPEPNEKELLLAEFDVLNYAVRVQNNAAARLHLIQEEDRVATPEEAQHISDLIEISMEVLAESLYRAATVLKPHRVLGLTWTEFIDRVFPPNKLPAWLYVRMRDEMLAYEGAQ